MLGSYEVGIWLVSTQTQLASAVVTPNTPRYTDGFGNASDFLYAPIPPMTIPAGDSFVVAALLPDHPLDAWLSDIQNVNAAGIIGLASGRYMAGSTLSFPSQAWGYTVAVANASQAFAPAPVPEPTTAAYIAFGLGCYALYRRRSLGAVTA